MENTLVSLNYHSIFVTAERNVFVSGNCIEPKKRMQKINCGKIVVASVHSTVHDILLLDENRSVHITTFLDYAAEIPDPVSFFYNITHISCGAFHSLLLSDSGDVWGFGKNECGQLGVEKCDLVEASAPVLIKGLPPIESLSCGGYHSMFVDFKNTLWGCGRNCSGQLGIVYEHREVCLPQKINENNNLPPVKSVYCGAGYHTLFIDIHGQVWGCGNNRTSVLGKPKEQENELIHFPVKLNLTDIKSISSADYHTLFLSEDGKVYGCGQNRQFQLGIRDQNTILEPILLPISPAADIKIVSCGRAHSIFVDANGRMWGCGASTLGQLGNKASYQTPTLLEDFPLVDLSWAATIIRKSARAI